MKTPQKTFHIRSNPETDWKIIFFATCFLILLTILLNIFFYVTLGQSEVAVGNGEDQPIETLNIRELRQTTQYYQDKAAKGERILKATSTLVVDPAL